MPAATTDVRDEFGMGLDMGLGGYEVSEAGSISEDVTADMPRFARGPSRRTTTSRPVTSGRVSSVPRIVLVGVPAVDGVFALLAGLR